MVNKQAEEKFIYKPVTKNKDAIPVWLCFPSTYMIGMSSLGYLSLFRILDENPEIYPERVFTDTEKTEISPNQVEMIGFSFSFELDFLGVFKIFEKYKIPFEAKDRTPDHPIIFGGGPVLTANPEPYADFFDVILLGDGEEILNELIETYKSIKYLNNKEDILARLANIPGVYVPSLYKVDYNQDLTIKSIQRTRKDIPESIKRRCHEDLQKYLHSPIITHKSMFPDMFLVEIARGCPRRCRFCLASYLNFPARYPKYDDIINAIDLGLQNSHKIGLLGALIAEHPDFDKICKYLLKRREKEDFEISVSSLRADLILPETVKMLVEGGQRNTTIAAEAGSERLRRFINKNLDESQIADSVKIARENGLSGLKIYGMIGLPTETQDDIDELISLMKKLKNDNKGFKLTLSISSFVQKAQTPFQWEKREANKILQEKNDYLKKELAKAKIDFKPTSIKWGYVQSVLSMGDRRLSSLIKKVYRYNGTLGSWGRSYKELKEETDLNIPALDWYALREKPYDETLPWEMLDSGIDKAILQKEREISYKIIN